MTLTLTGGNTNQEKFTYPIYRAVELAANLSEKKTPSRFTVALSAGKGLGRVRKKNGGSLKAYVPTVASRW